MKTIALRMTVSCVGSLEERSFVGAFAHRHTALHVAASAAGSVVVGLMARVGARNTLSNPGDK